MTRLTKDRSDKMAKLAKLLREMSDDGLKLVLEFTECLKKQAEKKIGKG